MMSRIRNSWALFTRSIQVMTENKKLLLFPLVNLAAIGGILLFFFTSFLVQPTGHRITEKAHWKTVAQSIFTAESLERAAAESAQAREAGQPRRKSDLELNAGGIKLVAIIYFLSIFVATFFNVAFYHEILGALRDEPVSLRRGIGFAMSRLPAVLYWSLFAGAVGYLIKSLEERMGLIGRLVMRLIGTAWSVAAVFAIPVIVCQPVTNPFEVLKTSAATLKKTWGESLAMFVGFQGLGLVVIFGSMIPFAALVIAGAMLHTGVLVALAVIGWITFLIAFGYVAGVAGNVYQCALYVYASTGQIPDGFNSDMMQSGWKHKK